MPLEAVLEGLRQAAGLTDDRRIHPIGPTPVVTAGMRDYARRLRVFR